MVWNGFWDFIHGNDLFYSMVAVGFWGGGKDVVVSAVLVDRECVG